MINDKMGKMWRQTQRTAGRPIRSPSCVILELVITLVASQPIASGQRLMEQRAKVRSYGLGHDVLTGLSTPRSRSLSIVNPDPEKRHVVDASWRLKHQKFLA